MLKPKLPKSWPSAKIDYRYHSSLYQITIENSSSTGQIAGSLEVDGKVQTDREYPWLMMEKLTKLKLCVSRSDEIQ